jgi:hypothetical protein
MQRLYLKNASGQAFTACAPVLSENDSTKVNSVAYLHIDLVLSALIGPEDAPIERFIAAAERGEYTLEIMELALYCAWCSVRPGDDLKFSRFAKLLQVSQIVPSPKPFDAPTDEEISHWRDVVFGRDTD